MSGILIRMETVLALAGGTLALFAAPLVLLLALFLRRKIRALPLGAGALSFFVSQIVLRIPILTAAAQTERMQALTLFYPGIYMLILCFSAGVFEESARLAGAICLKKHRSWKDILSFGLGHGLCEVVLLTGLTMGSDLVCALLLNSGKSLGAGTEQLAAQLSAVTAGTVCLAVLERFSAVVFHLSATALIFYGAERKRYFCCWAAAVLAHGIFNLAGVSLAQRNLLLGETVMALAALAGGWYLYRKRSAFPKS